MKELLQNGVQVGILYKNHRCYFYPTFSQSYQNFLKILTCYFSKIVFKFYSNFRNIYSDCFRYFFNISSKFSG